MNTELKIDLFPTMEVFHLNLMDHDLSDRVNREGWLCCPASIMYCDITMSGENQADAAQAAWSEGAYKRVATVDGNDLDVAFERTNHIDKGWELNEGVKHHGMFGKNRSTSVGDIVRKGEKLYLCASFGWTELGVA